MFPEEITITYRGEAVPLLARRDWVDLQGEAHRQPFFGYELICPRCSTPTLLSVRVHKIIIAGDKVTAHPSLVCPHACGWHVWLQDGVAVDC